MKTAYSRTWKSSIQPRKQRKYRHNAPHHARNTLMNGHLSPELRKQHKKRSMPVKKGDVASIMTGTFKGKTGKISHVNTKKLAAYIEGIETARRDGTRVQVPIKASNIMLIELNKEDKRRIKNG